MSQEHNTRQTHLSRTFFLSACALACALGSFAAPRVASASALPITGWAWGGTDTDSLDWISFSSANPNSGGGTYGVYEDSATGALSGYAWANNLGWITFEAAKVSGCPSAPCAPSVNLTTGKLTGWARACSAFADKTPATGCTGALDSNSGGWDGWVALSGTAADSSAYGVTQNLTTGVWTGYAWGSDSIGAIGMTSGAGVDTSSISDLTAGTVSPTSVTTGTTIFSATITNAPTAGSTVSGFTNLFQRAASLDGNGNGVNVSDIGTFVQPTALSAGATATASLSYATSTAGTFYMRVCADKSAASDTGTVLESNETNNCGGWTQVTVTLPLLTGSFSASPDTIDPGRPSTLTWTSNATTCVGQGTFSTGAGNPANGSATVAPTTPGPNGYQITCTKSGYAPLTLATTVTVISITTTISAKPTCISGGGSSKISWSVLPVSQIQAGSCRLSGLGLSSNPLSVSPDGSAPNASPQTAVVPPGSKSIYTISCATTGGATVTKSAVVDVHSCWTEF